MGTQMLALYLYVPIAAASITTSSRPSIPPTGASQDGRGLLPPTGDNHLPPAGRLQLLLRAPGASQL
jgi:hypothetical protein